MCQGCARDVPGMCQECARDVPGMCQGCARDVPGMCQGCARDLLQAASVPEQKNDDLKTKKRMCRASDVLVCVVQVQAERDCAQGFRLG
jgi:hypothetical protein